MFFNQIQFSFFFIHPKKATKGNSWTVVHHQAVRSNTPLPFPIGKQAIKSPRKEKKPTKPNRAYSPSTKAHNKNPAKRSFRYSGCQKETIRPPKHQDNPERKCQTSLPSLLPQQHLPDHDSGNEQGCHRPCQYKQNSHQQPTRQYPFPRYDNTHIEYKSPKHATISNRPLQLGNSHRHAKGAKPESGKAGK